MNAYDRAVNEIKNERREAEDRGRLIFRAALERDDQLAAAYKTYLEQMHLHAKGQKNTYNKAVADLKKALKAAGLSVDKLDPPRACTKCNDTGRLPNGAYCPCVITRVINSDKQNLTLPPQDFDARKATAMNDKLQKRYAEAEAYVNAYPSGKPFFVLSGTAGTGKTVLAAAIASKLMTRGAAAVTVTAFSFVRRALDYHTQFSIPDYVDRFTPMLDCDVLVIDDLGTESMLKNVTQEYLYTVINERWQAGKYTVITTNLDARQLLSRYGESVFSRMCDKSKATLFKIDGTNIRLGLKPKADKK